MSDISATATGRLLIDASGVDAGVNQAGRALDTLTNITRNSYFGLRNLALGFEAVGTAAVGIIGTSAKAATDWEAGMAKIEVSTFGSTQAIKDNAGAVGELNGQFRSIAENTPVPIKSIQQVGDTVARLGVAYQDVAPITQTVIDLNQATGVSFDTVATTVGKAAGTLGLGAQGTKQFASAIFEAQRISRASGEDILTLYNRIGGIGEIAGISIPSMVNWSAQIASVGGNVRTNASAFGKLVETIQTSVTTNNANLGEFARIGGYQSAKDFATAWATDPAAALEQVVLGIGRMNDAQGQGQAELQKVGFTTAAQVGFLLNLGKAQTENAGTSQSYAGAQQQLNTAFRDGNALQNATALLYGTTAARLQEARNEAQLAAVGFGSLFLPALRGIATVAQDVARGLQVIPGPVREVFAVATVLVGGIGILGGAVLLLLPKFILARDTLIQMAAAAGVDAKAKTGLAVATSETLPPMEALVELTRMLVATQLVLIGEADDLIMALDIMAVSEGEAAVGAGTLVVAEEEAAASSGIFSAAAITLQAALGPLGLITLGIGAAIALMTGGIAYLGAQQKDAATSTNLHATADQNLLGKLQGTTAEVNKNTDAWIVNKLAQDGTLNALISIAQQLPHVGSATAVVTNMIKGNLSKAETDQFISGLQLFSKVPGVSPQLITSLQSVMATLQATKEAQVGLRKAQKDGVDTTDSLGTATDSLNGKIETAQQKYDKAQQAAQGYAQAALAVASASQQTWSAEQALIIARENLALKSTFLKDAEDKVAIARTGETIAADHLRDAETTLANAREDANRKLAEAQTKLTGDEQNLTKSHHAVADAQARVNETMKPENTVLKLKEATDALRRSELDLIDAQTGVSDAQWYLNYLQEEGASNRDISDAKQLLAKNSQTLEEKTNGQATAQNKLNDMQGDAGSIARDQANAQDSLASAILGVTQAEQALKDQQIEVSRQQDAIAHDEPYHNALLAEQQAQEGVQSAHLNVTTALQNLHAIQNGSLEHAFAAANIAVQQAVIAEATAMTDLDQKVSEMHGHTMSASAVTSDLAGHIRDLSGAAGPANQKILDNYAGVIKTVGTNMFGVGTQIDNLNTSVPLVGPNFDASKKSIDEAGGSAQKATPLFGGLFDRIGKGIDYMTGQKGNKVLDFLIGISNPVTAPLAVAGGISNLYHGIFGAEGGYFDRPTMRIIGEAGPEVLLPLNNPGRAYDLAASSGLLSVLSNAPMSPVGASGGGGASVTHIDQSKTVHQGAFAPNVVVQSDPESMVDDYFWRNRVLSRSA